MGTSLNRSIKSRFTSRYIVYAENKKKHNVRRIKKVINFNGVICYSWNAPKKKKMHWTYK